MHRFISVLLVSAFLCCISISGYAQKNDRTAKQFEIQDVMSLDFEENIALPKVKEKYKTAIVAHQRKTGERLIKQGYKVETTRKGEVLIVSIPAHSLFSPNSIVLNEDAIQLLSPILSLSQNKMYKILIAMHSDNTGSDYYLENLTHSRILAIYEWYNSQSSNTTVIPFAMGCCDPIAPNNSRLNRQNNRRLEVYIIPSEQMIEYAKINALR